MIARRGWIGCAWKEWLRDIREREAGRQPPGGEEKGRTSYAAQQTPRCPTVRHDPSRDEAKTAALSAAKLSRHVTIHLRRPRRGALAILKTAHMPWFCFPWTIRA